MYMESDYIRTMIHEMVRSIIEKVFRADISREEEAAAAPEYCEQYCRLCLMIGEGKIREAERYLLDQLDADHREYFRMALLVYDKINEKPDEFLEEHAFSRQEVIDGLKYVVRVFECAPLIDRFLEDYLREEQADE